MEGQDAEEKRMNKYVNNLVNYVYEEAFYVDKDIVIDSRYEELFKDIYYLFESKGITNKYYEIMKLYISRCLVSSDYLSLEVLLDNICCLKGTTKIKQQDLVTIKNKFIVPQKRLKLN